MSRAILPFCLLLCLFTLACQTKRVSAPAKALASVSEPSFFSAIPADTPYLMVLYEPIAAAVLERAGQRAAPVLAALHAEIDQFLAARAAGRAAPSVEARVGRALLQELKAILDWPKIAEFVAHTQMALYGLGPFPALRLELLDATALDSLIARVESRAGVAAPRASFAGTEYRSVDLDGTKLVFAIVGRQLIAGLIPKKNSDAHLARLFGQTKPARNILEAGRLAELRSSYGYRGYWLGYIDFRPLTDLLVGNAATQPSREELGLDASIFSPECQAEITGLVGLAPRLVMGLEELSVGRSVGSMVLELAPHVAGSLGSLVAPVPGLAGRPDGRSLASFGLGLDVQRAVEVAKETARQLRKSPFRCEKLSGLNQIAAELASANTSPMAMIGPLKGVQVTLSDIVFGKDGKVELKGFLVLQHESPSMLLGLLQMALDLPEVDITSDGAPVPLPLPPGLSSPFLVEPMIAMRGATLVLSVGTGMAGRVSALLGDSPGAESPLLAVAFDDARLFELGEKIPELRSLLDWDAKAPSMFQQSINAAAAIRSFVFVAAHVTTNALQFRFWKDLR